MARIDFREGLGRPMIHSIIGGVIGFIIATIGAVVMWDKPPHWYAVTTLPCAWISAILFIKNNSK
jgi:hypothetical protein